MRFQIHLNPNRYSHQTPSNGNHKQIMMMMMIIIILLIMMMLMVIMTILRTMTWITITRRDIWNCCHMPLDKVLILRERKNSSTKNLFSLCCWCGLLSLRKIPTQKLMKLLSRVVDMFISSSSGEIRWRHTYMYILYILYIFWSITYFQYIFQYISISNCKKI